MAYFQFNAVPIPILCVCVILLIVVIRTASLNRRHTQATDQRLCRGCGTSHPTFASFCRRCGRKL